MSTTEQFLGRHIEALRRQLSSDNDLATCWEQFAIGATSRVAEATEWLARLAHEKSRAETLGGNRWLRYGNSLRELSLHLANRALVRAVRNDGAPGEGEIELAAHIFAAKEWRAQGYIQKPIEWKSDLWTGDMAHNMALWLTWTTPWLQPENVEQWQQALGSRGIAPIMAEWVSEPTRIHALDTMGHNWWSVIVAGAGVAALVIGEPATAWQIRDNLLAWLEFPGNILHNKSRTFSGDGSYIETPSYCDYALSNYLTFAFAFQDATGDDSLLTHPALRRLPDWYLAHCYPLPEVGKWRYVNFGDCSTMVHRSGIWLGLALAVGDERLAQAYRAAGGRPGSIAEFLWYRPLAVTGGADSTTANHQVHVAENMVYPEGGLAFLRSADGSDLFAMRAGEVWNHNHCDPGTFVFYSGGKEWIGDPGRVTYSRPEYVNYFIRPQAHNVIMRDGQGMPRVRSYLGTHFNGSFPAFWQHGGYRYLLADLCGPYAGIFDRFYRHVLWLDGVGVVLVDDVAALEPVEYTYLLHPEALLVPTGAEGCYRMERDNNSRGLAVFASVPTECAEEQGPYIGRQDKEEEDKPLPTRPYYTWRTVTRETHAKFVSAFGFSGELDAKLLRLHETLLEFHISSPAAEWIIWINEQADGRAMHRNGWQEWKDVRTDAFLVAHCVSTNRTFLHNGSYLRQGDETLFSSWVKANAASTRPLRT